jgi:uncharacterized protein (TIGR02757 family)
VAANRSSPQLDPGISGPAPFPSFSRDALDELYDRYNRREFVHPDPLEFLYNYEDLRDRELVGLVASSLAYGRVNQILKSVSTVLERLGPSPSRFLERSSPSTLHEAFRGFKHRFTTGDELADLLSGARRIVLEYGSMEDCFAAGMGREDSTVLPALTRFVKELTGCRDASGCMFLPSPLRGSACKRLNLFLRWMVRRDDVDPGGWSSIAPSKLIVPLDTHMFRIGSSMNLTQRKQADMRTALEITSGFQTIVSSDPVKYDFSLTRLGIRRGMD